MEKKKLTGICLFSGFGCQDTGIKNSEVFDFEVLATSEIDKEAILSYAAMQNGMTMEMIQNYEEYPTVEEMIQELTEKHIGYDPKKKRPHNWDKYRNHEEILKKYWLANHLSKNFGDISRIESLPDADLWFTSFPCQDISIAGYQRGFKEDSETRSSLLWEQMRLLRKAVEDGTQPKFLMFENVKELVGKKFRPDFLKWLDELKELGYKVYWDVLNAKDCGVPQNRERVFVVCIREDIEAEGYTFPQPFPCDTKLEDIIELKAKRNKYVNMERVKAILEMLEENDTYPISEKMTAPENETITAPDDQGNVINRKKNRAPKPTPGMCFRLMGLTNDDVRKCRAIGVSDTQLYRQAGNGIVTNCAQLLAEHLYKSVYDPTYICTDEKMNGAEVKMALPLLNLEKKSA